MNQPEVMYYRAREDQTINNLPIFFGRVELQDERVKGKHYRARADLGDRVEGANKIYVIGYYWIDQDAPEFFKKFDANQLIRIDAAEFNLLVDRWTRGGEYSIMCWNPEKDPEAESMWAG